MNYGRHVCIVPPAARDPKQALPFFDHVHRMVSRRGDVPLDVEKREAGVADMRATRPSVETYGGPPLILFTFFRQLGKLG
jgi:hypothetical protein